MAQFPDFLKALEKEGIDFIVVQPSADQKDDYINRYKSRGNRDKWIDSMASKFELFVNSSEKFYPGKVLTLEKGQYLSDILHT